ncbi:MAG: pyrroline-5-carboxylate reductase [Candidatus Brocadiaceae bacterium]|nr:pyrroline-5-carboxylate reductase [Candidatus Brocadiaceae bacterium]
MLKEKIGFIGGGKMAEALCKGIIKAGLSNVDNIITSDAVPDQCKFFHEEVGVRTTQKNLDVISFADVIVFAVKPQAMNKVLMDIKNSISHRQLMVSIAAGIPIHFFESRLPEGTRVIRVMPNTPCLIGASATAFSLGKHATETDEQLVYQLFNAVGKAVSLEERYLDAVTGLSGSGPAYVYMFIEAMADGGVRMGLSRDVSISLAAQTVLGAAKMVLETGLHTAQLKDAVTSPAGTTIEGVSKLESGGFRAAIINAVEASALKSKQLGELL